jgi:hypothetical protein
VCNTGSLLGSCSLSEAGAAGILAPDTCRVAAGSGSLGASETEHKPIVPEQFAAT